MIVVDKRKYKMGINETAKEIHVQVHGLMREEDVEGYMKDLQDTIHKVPKQEYTFVVDATYQTPVPSKVVPQLGQTMQFYSSLGFKDIIVVKPSSKIAQVQIRNALERIEFPGKFVDRIAHSM
ncbi:hypothetical protein P4475_01110 [Halalkalibacterium halodurans]|uniref:STAS domain-containing protein n=1 Tax=Halalkalibacterium halodurans TaxID=86665 RepID=A0A0M0KEA0_ALKHA|nr:hypothetical protein [Halalkalibacterium halodurans]MED3645437.1 hypothetical protein [Halalkalibacterium halodurans]TES53192.1 hypothetical protein E2L07_12950 [Halalkalibacterium halodurans]TPE69383.1 hypothetical protein AMD02_008645 [Halalkalibacterium halodurans]